MKKITCVLIMLFVLLIAFEIYAAGIEQSNPYIQWFRSTTGSTITPNQISVGATATVIKAAPSAGHYRHSILIKNTDTTNTVYIGASGVTTGTGFPLKPGETMTLDRNYAAVYGICAGGITVVVAYLEEGS